MATSFPMSSPWTDLSFLNAPALAEKITTPINDLFALIGPHSDITGEDLNNVTAEGLYTAGSGVVTNVPSAGRFVCAVRYIENASGTASYVTQDFCVVATGARFSRSQSGGTWTSWIPRSLHPGTTSATTDASGNVTVTHGLGFTPSMVFIQHIETGSTLTNAAFGGQVVSRGSTTFSVRVLMNLVSAGGSNYYLAVANALTARFDWVALP